MAKKGSDCGDAKTVNALMVCLNRNYDLDLPVLGDPIDPKSRIGKLYQLPVTSHTMHGYVYYANVNGQWEVIPRLLLGGTTVYMKKREPGRRGKQPGSKRK